MRQPLTNGGIIWYHHHEGTSLQVQLSIASIIHHISLLKLTITGSIVQLLLVPLGVAQQYFAFLLLPSILINPRSRLHQYLVF